ncbi:hypothetical protein U9M48_000868 [Paspalum notatum var. saurae]|uniref:Pentatricopeptide repeat-containing protein n=1 Tax=Paspalum notatum var. saurae TaxID=547442 RepID=A0AAQ3PN94_PASNO
MPMPFHPLATHPHPAVAAFPCAGFSFLAAAHPLLARAVHGLSLRRALPLSAFLSNTLLAFYFCDRASPAAALRLFDEMPRRTPSSWYTAVSGCVRCGLDSTAFALLRDMRGRGVPLSGFALASLITACERCRGWEEGGAAIHALTLLHLYGSCGLVSDAWIERRFLDGDHGGVVIERDEVAGLQVAAHVMVSGLQRHVSVANSLITMFGNLRRAQDAERLFDRMEERDRISWNAMISMYSHEGVCGKCFMLLSDMRRAGVRPDVMTLCSLVPVCASSDHVAQGSGVHSLCIRSDMRRGGVRPDVTTLCSLVSVCASSDHVALGI